jgi:DNA-binding response OmpR family regulator
MKILLLDDEENILSSTKRALEYLHHSVDCANNAKKALTMAENGDYDFALVDYMMPENDGIWFMRHAKFPKKTRILLVTAFVNRQVIDEMFKLGACGYLIKPIDTKELSLHLDFHSHPQPAE